jgi:hypothetical protein
MANRKDYLIRPLHAVFTFVDMHGGSKTQCWEWLGSMSPKPLFYWNNKRLQANRVIYSLKHGIHYNDVPKLVMTCGNDRCVNHNHAIPFKSIARRIGAGGINYQDALKDLTKEDKQSIREYRKELRSS